MADTRGDDLDQSLPRSRRRNRNFADLERSPKLFHHGPLASSWVSPDSSLLFVVLALVLKPEFAWYFLRSLGINDPRPNPCSAVFANCYAFLAGNW